MSEIQHTFGNGFCLRSSYSDVKEGFTRWLWTALESLWWRGSGLEASCLFFPFLYMIWGATWDFSPFPISGMLGKARKLSLMWSLSTLSWTVRNCTLTETRRSGTRSHMHELCGVIVVSLPLTSALRLGELLSVKVFSRALQPRSHGCQRRDASLCFVLEGPGLPYLCTVGLVLIRADWGDVMWCDMCHSKDPKWPPCR